MAKVSDVIEEVFKENNWSLERKEKTYESQFQAGSHVYTLRIFSNSNFVVCNSRLPFVFDERNSADLFRLVHKINYSIGFGCFEIGEASSSVNYRVGVMFGNDDDIHGSNILWMLMDTFFSIEKYAPAIASLLDGSDYKTVAESIDNEIEPKLDKKTDKISL